MAVRVSSIRNRGRFYLRYDAGGASRGRREAGRYMSCWCDVVWDVEGGDFPARRHSHRGHRVELWRIADWLKNDKKTVESEAEQTPRVYLAFIRQKQGKRALDQLQGSRGEFFT